MSKRTFTLSLVAVLMLALIVRGAAAYRYADLEPQTDALDYDRHAVSIAEGDGFPDATELTGGPGPTAWRPPLYPFVLGGVYAISGTSDEHTRWTAGRIVQVVFGVGVVGLIALVAFQLWGRVEALIAAGLTALYPPLILAGTSLLTEPLFIVLLLAGISAVLHYRQEDDRVRWLVLAGLCAGLAALARTNGLIAIAVFAIGLWTLSPRLSLKALRAPAIMVGIAALMIAPWTIRNAFEMDAFVPVSTQTGFAVAGQYNEVADGNKATWLPPFDVPDYRSLFTGEPLGEVELGERLTNRSIEYAADHPGHLASAAFWNGLRFLNLDDPVETERSSALFSGQPQALAELSVYAFWLLALVTIAACFSGAARRMPLFIWIMPPLFLLSVMFVVAMTRYRTPMDPIFLMISSAFIASVLDRVRARRQRTPV